MREHMQDLVRFKRRLNLLWISALGKETSLKEIGEVWKYKTHIPLYKDKLPQLLVDARLWKIVRIEDREAKYLSIFDGYPEFIKIYPKTEFTELFLADFDKFKAFLEDEYIRKALFDIDNVKIFFKNRSEYAQMFGHMLPIVALYEALTFLYFKEIIFFEAHLFFNTAEYCQKAFASLDTEQMRKWAFLLDTKFGKHIIEQIENTLRNSTIQKLIESRS
jgi:hypothetical protein